MLRMKSTMTYSFGDVVLVDFPFSSNIGIKKRPAVVISNFEFNKTKEDIVLLVITSKIDNVTIGEALLKNWKEAGLVKPSAFKSVIFTVEKEHIDKSIGNLTDIDKEVLLNCLSQIIEYSKVKQL